MSVVEGMTVEAGSRLVRNRVFDCKILITTRLRGWYVEAFQSHGNGASVAPTKSSFYLEVKGSGESSARLHPALAKHRSAEGVAVSNTEQRAAMQLLKRLL